MADYHKYVFDIKQRKLVGQFEEMYQQESIVNFDSWHQDDSRQLNRKVSLAMIEQFNFETIVDVGCGKGALTHLLKKRNNHVLGLDISQTAIDIAKSRFPDIVFKQVDVNKTGNVNDILSTEFEGEKVDLIFSAECFSYLDNWRSLLSAFSNTANYVLICLYIPENPIGCVKSADELERDVASHFDILEFIQMKTSNFNIIFGKSRELQDSL